MDELVLLEPREIFNDFIVGVSQRPLAVVYNKDKIIEYWAKEFLSEQSDEAQAYMEAVEFFEFNIQGAYMGEHTPIYVSMDDKEMLLDHISL